MIQTQFYNPPLSIEKKSTGLGHTTQSCKTLADRGHHVEVKILDNEVSAEFKKKIVKDWGASYQLVPPNVHRRNIAEKAIRTFKAYFMAILEVVDPEFPKFMWDNLLVQTEITINLLRQENLNPRMSAWEYYNVVFDYSATPYGSQWCGAIIKRSIVVFPC